MENLAQHLIEMERGLVFLSAPTGAGKTQLVQAIKAGRANVTVLSGERFLDAILRRMESNGAMDLRGEFGQYGCVCVEDLDWYRGRVHTQYAFAEVLSRLAEMTTVIVTGIDLKTRLEKLFSMLENFEYYEKNNLPGSGKWADENVAAVNALVENR